MQTRKGHGGRGENGDECKQQKRPRSTQVHNLNERIRRKKLTEKMATLQEMIPNSVKKDQASTIDDAIKYIKTLQCQVQMMSSEASHTLFHSPMVSSPQLGRQGIQIPNLAPFSPIPTAGTQLSMGMYPVGLTNPWLLQSPVNGPGLPTAHSIQNNTGQLFETIYADSIPCFGSQLSIGANGEA
ncbi:phytochrome interacting factor 3 [Perilla frutescens var. frutescens]|nr:phytochrome interacting factor 3 [Perilla frutescens var. frutescens]